MGSQDRPAMHFRHRQRYLMVEYLFVTACLGIMVFSHHLLQVPFHFTYLGFIALALILSPFQKQFLQTFLSPYGICLVISFVVLLGYFTLGYGDRITDTLKCFIRATPLFLLGNMMHDDPKGRRFVLGSFLLLYTVASLPHLVSLDKTLGDSVSREYIATLIVSGSQASAVVQQLIYLFPTLSATAIVSVALLDFRNKFTSWLFLGAITCISLIVILSTWTSASVILLAGMFGIAAQSIWCSAVDIRSKLVFLSGCVLLVLLLTAVVSQSDTWSASASGKFARRISSIGAIITGQSAYADLDTITGCRFSLAGVSIDGFLQSPLNGLGDYYFDPHIGGHSSIFDVLARYGLMGAIPLFGMLSIWLYCAIWYYHKAQRSLESTAIPCVFCGVSCFVDTEPLFPKLCSGLPPVFRGGCRLRSASRDAHSSCTIQGCVDSK